MMRPLFSVILPVFNRAELLTATLDSVAAQIMPDWELIVVDDGSTDDIGRVVKNRAVGACVLRQHRRGPGAARNLGAKHARGRYLAFLDSDDVWFPWSLSSYAEIIRKHSPSLIFGAACPLRAEPKPLSMESLTVATFPDYLASTSQFRWIGCSSMAVEQRAFQACGGFFDERPVNGEDLDLALRLGTAPGFAHITSPATVAYREHAGNVVKDFDRTLAGMQLLLDREAAGEYPGGRTRARERLEALTRFVRPVTFEAARQRRFKEASRLYARMFLSNVRLGRIRYLVGFPMFLAAHAGGLRSPRRSRVTLEPDRPCV